MPDLVRGELARATDVLAPTLRRLHPRLRGFAHPLHLIFCNRRDERQHAAGFLTDAAAARLAFREVPSFGSVYAEGLLQSSPSLRSDNDGVAALHPLHPAEIEEAIGDRGP